METKKVAVILLCNSEVLYTDDRAEKDGKHWFLDLHVSVGLNNNGLYLLYAKHACPLHATQQTFGKMNVVSGRMEGNWKEKLRSYYLKEEQKERLHLFSKTFGVPAELHVKVRGAEKLLVVILGVREEQTRFVSRNNRQ